jgi:hypothetical protein
VSRFSLPALIRFSVFAIQSCFRGRRRSTGDAHHPHDIIKAVVQLLVLLRSPKHSESGCGNSAVRFVALDSAHHRFCSFHKSFSFFILQYQNLRSSGFCNDCSLARVRRATGGDTNSVR